ncbi:hypothetical protein FQA39_LY19136, partial [Lamprigera yunnana]
STALIVLVWTWTFQGAASLLKGRYSPKNVKGGLLHLERPRRVYLIETEKIQMKLYLIT